MKKKHYQSDKTHIEWLVDFSVSELVILEEEKISKMNANLIPLFDKRRFDFSFLTSTGTHQVILASALELVQYKSVFLMIRVHEITISAGQSFLFTLDNTLPSDEDPQEFTDTTASILSVSVSSGTTAPKLLSGSGTNPLAFGKLVLTVAQGGTGGTPLYAELSASLLGRSE